MSEGSDVYYRVYWSKDNELTIVTMQWFDEHDYDQSRFLTDTHFPSEKEARQWLNGEAIRILRLYPAVCRYIGQENVP